MADSAGVQAAPTAPAGGLRGFDPDRPGNDIGPGADATGAPSAVGHGVAAQAETEDGQEERPAEDEADSEIYGAQYEANMADARAIWSGVPVQTVARPSGAGMSSSDVQWSGGLARALRVVGPRNFGQTPEDGTADPAGAAFQTVLNGAKFNATPGGTPQWISATPGQPGAEKAFTLLTGQAPAYTAEGRAIGQADLGDGMEATVTLYPATSTSGPSISFRIEQAIAYRGSGGLAINRNSEIISGKIRF
jgi:hypothetical protein